MLLSQISFAYDTLGTLIDGPYVSYQDDKATAQYIYLQNGAKIVITEELKKSKSSPITLRVPTDLEGIQFTVKLKSKHNQENAESNTKARLFIVSDIEANFKAFRTILQANNIIDEKLQWKFGDGRLILTGDFFDRGQQLTEVLWLIYSLEEQAKLAKGYVHFVLGNHEIMNLNGDLRYVPRKYHDHARLMNRSYLSLYDEKTELGKWLRSKNIIEKIGNGLFTHGGISQYVNMLSLSVNEINKLARPYYADTSYNYPTPTLDLLFSNWGPLWYRGYYLNGPEKATMSSIDSTLSIFNVSFIATGHTIVKEEVDLYFNGKVINTDVSHAKGISQAILIEDKKIYRVNDKGIRTALN